MAYDCTQVLCRALLRNRAVVLGQLGGRRAPQGVFARALALMLDELIDGIGRGTVTPDSLERYVMAVPYATFGAASTGALRTCFSRNGGRMCEVRLTGGGALSCGVYRSTGGRLGRPHTAAVVGMWARYAVSEPYWYDAPGVVEVPRAVERSRPWRGKWHQSRLTVTVVGELAARPGHWLVRAWYAPCDPELVSGDGWCTCLADIERDGFALGTVHPSYDPLAVIAVMIVPSWYGGGSFPVVSFGDGHERALTKPLTLRRFRNVPEQLRGLHGFAEYHRYPHAGTWTAVATVASRTGRRIRVGATVSL